MATTTTRPLKGRPQSAPGTGPQPTITRPLAGTAAKTTPAAKTLARALPRTTAPVAPKAAGTKLSAISSATTSRSAKLAIQPKALPFAGIWHALRHPNERQAGAQKNAPGVVKQRLHAMLDELDAVSLPPPTARQKQKWPRWKKILMWAVMLMPVYAILIYLVGAFYFLPFEMKGVGLNKAFSTHSQEAVGPIAVPDQEGVFLQTNADPHADLSMIMQYNDRSLQPPTNEQLVLKPTGLHYILVRQAQVFEPNNYIVYSMHPNGYVVMDLTGQRVKSPGIAVVALSMPNGKPWPAGSYAIDVPEAGLDDGDFWCYFTITA
jgi:hypothetical protein